MLVVDFGGIPRRLRCFSFALAMAFGASLSVNAQDNPSTEDSADPSAAIQEPSGSNGQKADSQETVPEVPPIEVTQPVQPVEAPKPKPDATPSGPARMQPTSRPAPARVYEPIDADVTAAFGGADGNEYKASSYSSATGPVDGYVASDTTTGTKSGVPIIETPQSVSVITQDQMRARQVETLSQALRYTPGVTGESFGLDNRGYGLNIRGFYDNSSTMLYRDGLTLRGAGFAAFGSIEPYGAERIEVLRGPASVLYGGGEPAGIINYISKRPTYVPFHEVELIGGSFDHYEGRFDLSGPVSPGSNWAYRLTGSGRDSSTQVDYVDFDRMFIAPAFSFRNEKTSFTLLTNYQYDDQGWAQQFYPAQGTVEFNPNGTISSNRFTGEPNFDYYKNKQYSIGYLFEHRFNPTWTVRQNARYQGLDNSQRGVFGLGLQPNLRDYFRYGDGGETELDSFVIDNQIEAKFHTGRPIKHTLLMGLDYQDHTYSDVGLTFFSPTDPLLLLDLFDPKYGAKLSFLSPYYDTKEQQAQLGLYVQDQIKIYDKLIISLGGRSDEVKTTTRDYLANSLVESDDEAVTGRAGAVYLFDNGLAPYASVAQSFLPQLGTDIFGTPFVPETGQQYEAGFKYEPPVMKNMLFTFAAFDLYRQNVITIDPENPLNSVQSGEIRSRGIEIEAVASLDWGLDLQAAYTNLNTEFTKSNDGNQGNTPYGVPDHRVAIWADYTFQTGRLAGFGFGGGVRYIGQTWGDDANTFKVPAVTLADAAIHYEWNDSWRLAVNANNVFDKEYIAACFAYENGCNFGERRTVLGSLRYRW